MNRTFETNFTVMPGDANYHYPMIFGGAFFSQMDLCVSQCVHRALHDSPCDTAVTHEFSGTYIKPCYVGDLVELRAQIIDAKAKSVVVEVEAFRERLGVAGKDLVAKAKFNFVTVSDVSNVAEKPEFLKYAKHGLETIG